MGDRSGSVPRVRMSEDKVRRKDIVLIWGQSRDPR
jgi:hypothetical protein